MYNLNSLPRKVLITYEEVLEQSTLGAKSDASNIRQAIQIAEERFIVPLLGWELYNDFREKKNVLVGETNLAYLQDKVGKTPVLRIGQYVNAIELVDTIWYQSLWIEHLWKITAEAVAYVSNPTNWVKQEAAGILMSNPKTPLSDGAGANSVDLKDLKWIQDNALMNRIDPLISGMKGWIGLHSTYFPLWPRDSACCGEQESQVERKSPYVNIYKNTDYYARR